MPRHQRLYLKECGSISLQTRRMTGDQIKVFQILMVMKIFSVTKHRKTKVFTLSRLTVIITEQNRLSAVCLGSISVNVFFLNWPVQKGRMHKRWTLDSPYKVPSWSYSVGGNLGKYAKVLQPVCYILNACRVGHSKP